jgi:cytochrome bd-type quinol oxidase subunit 2
MALQGIILGAYIQGIKTENGIFAGGSFDWLSPFTIKDPPAKIPFSVLIP